MNQEIYQKIFDILQPVLPHGWKKMVLFAAYTTGSYTMKYYSCDDKDVYTDCFSQKGTNRAELIRLFMNIDQVVSLERKKLDEKRRWSVMTLIVSEAGSVKTEFDYSDINENVYEYERNWKKKYLK